MFVPQHSSLSLSLSLYFLSSSQLPPSVLYAFYMPGVQPHYPTYDLCASVVLVSIFLHMSSPNNCEDLLYRCFFFLLFRSPSPLAILPLNGVEFMLLIPFSYFVLGIRYGIPVGQSPAKHMDSPLPTNPQRAFAFVGPGFTPDRFIVSGVIICGVNCFEVSMKL